jgi:hypothetical protein
VSIAQPTGVAARTVGADISDIGLIRSLGGMLSPIHLAVTGGGRACIDAIDRDIAVVGWVVSAKLKFTAGSGVFLVFAGIVTSGAERSR